MIKKIKEDYIAISIAQKIIKEGVSDQIAFNIIDFKDFKEIWNKLKSIYIKIDQEIVYLIF